MTASICLATVGADGEEKYALPKRRPKGGPQRGNHVSVRAKRDAKPHSTSYSYAIAPTLEAVRNYAAVIKTGPSYSSRKYLQYLSRKHRAVITSTTLIITILSKFVIKHFS